MAIDWKRLFTPDRLLGAGLTLGSAFADQEPGARTEARQFLRNRFTSPTALGEQFSGQIGALGEQFQPLLTQQRQRGLADISQRFAAAFPKTVGAQGPEFGALGRYLTDEALPREQALLGDIGMNLTREQGRAAETILGEQLPRGVGDALGELGSTFLLRDLFGQRGETTGATGAIPRIMGTDGAALGIAPGLISRLASGNATADDIEAAGRAFQGGVPFARPEGVEGPLLPGGSFYPATAALGRPPGVEGPLMESGQFFSGTGGAAGGGRAFGGLATRTAGGGIDIGVKGAGLIGPPGLGSVQGVVSGLGSGAAGYGLGALIGRSIDQYQPVGGQASGAVSAIGGGAGGAAAGFAIGGPVGALIGAIAGGIGGLFGEGGARRARKEGQLAHETDVTGNQRPQALATSEQFFANGKQFNQALTAQAPQLAAAIDAKLAARDPQILALVEEAKALATRQGWGFMTQTGAPVSPDNLTGNVIVRFLDGAGSIGLQYDPKNASNPESSYGLLLSSETGRFGPGFERLQRNVQLANEGQRLAQRLMDAAMS